MSKEAIERLYKEWIIPESKTPYHFEKRVSEHIQAYNPMCGDKYAIYIDLPIHFYGHGCALSKASASLLMRELENRSVTEVKSFIQSFIQSVEKGEADATLNPALNTLIALKAYDGREDCILLAWKAMLEYLETRH